MPRKHLPLHDDEPEPINHLQKYAIVTKALGAGNFHVNIITNHQQNFNIIAKTPGSMKFKKNKNFVAIHSIILIQLRSFNQLNNVADILHVYKNKNLQDIINTHISESSDMSESSDPPNL